MVVYCSESERQRCLVAANLVAAQLLAKPVAVFASYGSFVTGKTHAIISDFIRQWIKAGYLDPSEISLIEYGGGLFSTTEVDVLAVELGRVRKTYGFYQACKKARHILVFATGEDQAELVAEAFQYGHISSNPLAILGNHEKVCLIADQAAVSKLSREYGIWYESC